MCTQGSLHLMGSASFCQNHWEKQARTPRLRLMSSRSQSSSRQSHIQDTLVQAFAPTVLQVENESHMHTSGANAESHFRVVIVTDAFEGKSLVARHRWVNQVLKAVFEDGLHALSVIPKTTQEYANAGELPHSPACSSRAAKAAERI